MPDLSVRLAEVRQRIATACAAAGREPAEVRLLAVSKGVPADVLDQALGLGHSEFGESYVQEALPKLAALAGRHATWHFIGPLQSNKTRDVAAHFDWAHGVDRLKIAQRLSVQRPADRGPLQVCVQVNISGEVSKSGCAPDHAAALCRAVAALPRLRLRGLMTLPAPLVRGAANTDPRTPFARLHRLFAEIRAQLPPDAAACFDTLSAGMSDDLEAAIAEGSTLVRIGTALFGARA